MENWLFLKNLYFAVINLYYTNEFMKIFYQDFFQINNRNCAMEYFTTSKENRNNKRSTNMNIKISSKEIRILQCLFLRYAMNIKI